MTKEQIIEGLRTRAKYTYTAEPEHDPVCWHFEDEEQALQTLRAAAESDWGWCTVKCTVTCGTLESVTYLGCCSYESCDDFLQNSGYAEDMATEALADLADQILYAIGAL